MTLYQLKHLGALVVLVLLGLAARWWGPSAREAIGEYWLGASMGALSIYLLMRIKVREQAREIELLRVRRRG